MGFESGVKKEPEYLSITTMPEAAQYSYKQMEMEKSKHKISQNKKYVLWNAGICPIAAVRGLTCSRRETT